MSTLAIETHAYSPEQNKVFIKTPNGFVPLPKKRPTSHVGIRTIKQARKDLLAPIKTPFIYATVKKTFPSEYSYLDSVKSGRVQSRKDVLKFIRDEKAKNQYGEFIDMSHSEYVESYTMPIPVIEITTRLIG